MRKTKLTLLLLAALLVGVAPAGADEVGSFTNDWVGNGIVVEAIADPKVEGVTCHMSHFERGFIDRLKKGNWFEDPSNNAISCQQTGPITIGDIELDREGEEVFKSGLSLIWKSLIVTRIYDRKNDTLIYLAHSREPTEGSAKMSISTVPLYGQTVTWTNGKL